jgi:uncharacterized protein (TIGR03000 family)
MRSTILAPRWFGLAWAALLLCGGSALAQSAGYPYPYTGYPYPLSSFSAAAPYWGSVPSYYGGAPLPYQEYGVSLKPVSNYLSSPPMFFPGYLGTASSSASALSNADILWPSSKAESRRDTRARIWLRVPADAEVWFNGAKTKQTGTLRCYLSPPLTAGRDYSYQVQVRWQKDGKTVERKRQVEVHAGDLLHLDFN